MTWRNHQPNWRGKAEGLLEAGQGASHQDLEVRGSMEEEVGSRVEAQTTGSGSGETEESCEDRLSVSLMTV